MYIEAGHPGRMGTQQQCWSLWCSGVSNRWHLEGGCPAWDGDRTVLPCASCHIHLRSHGAAQPNPDVF